MMENISKQFLSHDKHLGNMKKIKKFMFKIVLKDKNECTLHIITSRPNLGQEDMLLIYFLLSAS